MTYNNNHGPRYRSRLPPRPGRYYRLQMGALYEGGNLVYNIPNLDAGILYYIRVFAVSSVGTSEGTPAANNPVAPSQRPGAPTDISAGVIIGNGLELNSEIEVCMSNSLVFLNYG